MDLSQFAGTDYADLPLGGQTFRIGELTLREWAPVQAWIKATVPGPLSSLGSPDFARLPRDVKRDLLAVALEKDRTSWPPLIGSIPWMVALDHDGGHAVVLLAILAKHLPSITLDDCARVAESSKPLELLQVLVAAMGSFGPKSPAPSPPRNKKPTPRKRDRGHGAKNSPTTSTTCPTSSSRLGDGPEMTSSD